MRKRLQKKLCIGPFKEYGFGFHAVLKEGVDYEGFLDSFILFIEQNDLLCGAGGSSGKISFYVQLGTRKEPHSQKRQMVVDWLENNQDVQSIEAGPVAVDQL